MKENQKYILYQEEAVINMPNFTFFEVSGSQYFNSNVNSGIETYAANIVFYEIIYDNL